MNPEEDNRRFGRLVEALGPYRARVVFIGGWALRLYRHHHLSQPVSFQPLVTLDADVIITPGVEDDPNLAARLKAHGFEEEFHGEDYPPVTHFRLGADEGFYVEFLAPQMGDGMARSGSRRSTQPISGVPVQLLRHLDVLLTVPWNVSVPSEPGNVNVRVANPVSYVVQKLLISDRRGPSDRSKDILYIHDTLALFGGSLDDLKTLWVVEVQPTLSRRAVGKLRRARDRQFTAMTDAIREAALMARERQLKPESILDACRLGLGKILD